MLPKQSIIQYIMYINFYINAPHQPIEIWGRNVQGGGVRNVQGGGGGCETSRWGGGGKRPVGAKRPGAKRLGAKRLGEEMDLGRNVPEPFNDIISWNSIS